ncbi:cell division control protein 48 homolog C-like protein [Tanacetum coccineum]
MKEKDLEGDIDLEKISRATSGFVEADLVALVDKASNIALNRIIDGTKVAAKLVQPSTKREGFSSIPNFKWEDVGGLDSLRRELV